MKSTKEPTNCAEEQTLVLAMIMKCSNATLQLSENKAEYDVTQKQKDL